MTVKPQVNKYATAIAEFFKAFEPTVNMLKLVREEFNEWFQEIEDKGRPEDELKELCDLLYVIYGLAHTKGWSIEKDNKDIDAILEACAVHKAKYPDVNLPLVIIVTGYAELLTSTGKLWANRLVDGIHAYAKVKKWPIEQAFMRVHKSNMSKLTKEGKVLRREDGKVLKSDQYKPVDLKDLVNGKVDTKQKGSKGNINKSSIRSARL